MATAEENETALDWVLLLWVSVLLLLDPQELYKHEPLEGEKVKYLAWIGGCLADKWVGVLNLDRSYYKVIALDNFFEAFNHVLDMGLTVPLVILNVVDVVFVATAIHLHGLQVHHEVLKRGHPVDTQ